MQHFAGEFSLCGEGLQSTILQGTRVKSKSQVTCLIRRDSIRARIREMAREISSDYATRRPLLVGVLDGARTFMEDLQELLSVPVDRGFLRVASYGAGRRSTGSVRLVEDVPISPDGRCVLVIEDIVDSGLTLDFVRRHLNARGASEVRVCALLDKTACRKVPVPLDYVGFEIPDTFVVGYGLDWAGRFRDLPFIGALEEPRPAQHG